NGSLDPGQFLQQSVDRLRAAVEVQHGMGVDEMPAGVLLVVRREDFVHRRRGGIAGWYRDSGPLEPPTHGIGGRYAYAIDDRHNARREQEFAKHASLRRLL